MGISRLVYTFTHQGVVHICQRHHLGGNGNLVSLQSVRIAPAIVTFMMPAADLVSPLYQGLVLILLHSLQHIRTDDRMGLHDLKFLPGQLPGLVQDLLINGDLADIVKR